MFEEKPGMSGSSQATGLSDEAARHGVATVASGGAKGRPGLKAAWQGIEVAGQER